MSKQLITILDSETAFFTIVQRNSTTSVVFVSPEDIEKVQIRKWNINKGGYVTCSLHGKTIYLHRYLMNAPAHLEVDHFMNGNKLDNRRCNLKLVSTRENQQNRFSHRSGRLPGTFLVKECRTRPWKAQVFFQGKKYFLGMFATEKEANQCYQDFLSFTQDYCLF